MTEHEATTKGALGWDANFTLSWDILEYSIKDTDGIKSNIKTNQLGGKFLTGFSLTIPPSSAEEAIVIATEKGNRVADYLGSIHSLPVQAFLKNVTEIKPEGETKTGIATITANANIHQPVDLDFANIKKLLNCNDPKTLRQLAHYNFGLRYFSDPINQFREFYLVLEDEYGQKNQRLDKYAFIRHALNHPELTFPNFAKKLLDQIGASHLDPSSPEARKLVEANLKDLKQEARKVIEDIIKKSNCIS